MSCPELVQRIQEVLPSLEGWCSLEKAQLLSRVVVENNVELAVEIGVFGGASLLPIALTMQWRGSGRVYGIDPYATDAALQGVTNATDREYWEKINFASIQQDLREAIRRWDLDNHTELLVEWSQEAANYFAKESIGLLHVDGNHTELASVSNVALYYPKVKTGGWIFLDDLGWVDNNRATTIAAVRFLLEHRCTPKYLVNDCLVFEKK